MLEMCLRVEKVGTTVTMAVGLLETGSWCSARLHVATCMHASKQSALLAAKSHASCQVATKLPDCHTATVGPIKQCDAHLAASRRLSTSHGACMPFLRHLAAWETPRWAHLRRNDPEGLQPRPSEGKLHACMHVRGA
jgi:hypothetical protein